MMLNKSRLASFMLMACFFLNGCNLMKDFDREGEPEFNLATVDLILDTDANNTSATAIDLIVVYKPELMKALTKMSAEEYFKISDQIQRDYPETLRIWHWELTPGQSVSNYELDIPKELYDPFGALIFARYFTPGAHRVRVGSADAIHVLLKKDDLCILEQGCPGGALLLPTSTDNVPILETEKETKKDLKKDLKKESQEDLKNVQKLGKEMKKIFS